MTLRVLMVDAGNQTPFYVYPLCRALGAAGCDVELVTAPFPYGALPAVDFPVRYWFGRGGDLQPIRRYQPVRRVARALEYPLDWAAVLRHVRATRPDVVHVQWAMLPPVDAAAFRAIRRMGIRLVYTVHDIRPHYGRWRRALLSTRRLYDLADLLIVHTDANRLDLCRLTGRPADSVHVISQGNLSGWSGPPVPRDEARARLGLPSDAPIALFFGAIKPYKRLGFALRGFARLVERLPSARLLIAGRPDEPMAPHERLIDSLGLEHAVIKRFGYVPEEDVPRIFSAADVLALPYTDADFSGVVLAAYTYGLPVVATATGGLHQVIEDGRSGLIGPADDIEAFAENLLRVLGDRPFQQRLGARARDLAQTRYDWSIGAAELKAIYTR